MQGANFAVFRGFKLKCSLLKFFNHFQQVRIFREGVILNVSLGFCSTVTTSTTERATFKPHSRAVLGLTRFQSNG
jgi:hypothetical protein